MKNDDSTSAPDTFDRDLEELRRGLAVFLCFVLFCSSIFVLGGICAGPDETFSDGDKVISMYFPGCIVFSTILLLFHLVWGQRTRVFLYWTAVVALYFQALLLFFRQGDISAVAGEASHFFELSPPLRLTASIGALPFALPAFISWLTSEIVGRPWVGLATFVFFSISQVLVVGLITGQDRFTNRVAAALKLAIPILSLLCAVLNALRA